MRKLRLEPRSLISRLIFPPCKNVLLGYSKGSKKRKGIEEEEEVGRGVSCFFIIHSGKFWNKGFHRPSCDDENALILDCPICREPQKHVYMSA